MLLYAPLSQATAGMAGKKKEGVLRAWHTLAWTSRICTRPVRRAVSTPGAGETCSLPTLDPRGRGRNMAVAAMTRPGWRGRVPRRAFRVSAATPALPAHGRARHGASRSKGDRTLLRCRKSLRPRSPPGMRRLRKLQVPVTDLLCGCVRRHTQRLAGRGGAAMAAMRAHSVDAPPREKRRAAPIGLMTVHVTVTTSDVVSPRGRLARPCGAVSGAAAHRGCSGGWWGVLGAVDCLVAAHGRPLRTVP